MKVQRIDTPGSPSVGGKQVRSAPMTESPRERAMKAILEGSGSASTSPSDAPSVQAINSAPASNLGDLTSSTTHSSESVEAPAIESSQAAPSEPKLEESKLVAQYAKLVQREKALRAKEAEIKAKEEGLSKPAVLPVSDKLDVTRYISKDDLKKDPFKALNELGLGYEELTNLALAQPSPESLQQTNKMSALEAKIAELETKLSSTHKSLEDQQVSQRQQAITQISRDVKSLVDGNPEFETIKASGSYSSVVKLIERKFDEDGIMLDIEDAAKEIEGYLFDKYTKFANINKIKSRLSPTKSEASSLEQAASKPLDSQKQINAQPIKTLTNTVGTSRKLSRLERAMAAFKGDQQN